MSHNTLRRHIMGGGGNSPSIDNYLSISQILTGEYDNWNYILRFDYPPLKTVEVSYTTYLGTTGTTHIDAANNTTLEIASWVDWKNDYITEIYIMTQSDSKYNYILKPINFVYGKGGMYSPGLNVTGTIYFTYPLTSNATLIYQYNIKTSSSSGWGFADPVTLTPGEKTYSYTVNYLYNFGLYDFYLKLDENGMKITYDDNYNYLWHNKMLQ